MGTGRRGRDRQAWQGIERQAKDRIAMAGDVGIGSAWIEVERSGRHGKDRLGRVRNRQAGLAGTR
jgi:hypothetical protein